MTSPSPCFQVWLQSSGSYDCPLKWHLFWRAYLNGVEWCPLVAWLLMQSSCGSLEWSRLHRNIGQKHKGHVTAGNSWMDCLASYSNTQIIMTKVRQHNVYGTYAVFSCTEIMSDKRKNKFGTVFLHFLSSMCGLYFLTGDNFSLLEEPQNILWISVGNGYPGTWVTEFTTRVPI